MKQLILLFCFGLFFLSCKKSNENPYKSQGVLTGYDLGACAQCGGLLITIKNDTAKNPPANYHINSTLAQLGISESTPFPINVSLNYKPDTGSLGTFHFIIVTQIKVIK